MIKVKIKVKVHVVNETKRKKMDMFRNKILKE
jgi:hypothetical protein